MAPSAAREPRGRSPHASRAGASARVPSPRVASVGVHARAGGEHAPPRGDARLGGGRLATRPTAVARLTRPRRPRRRAATSTSTAARTPGRLVASAATPSTRASSAHTSARTISRVGGRSDVARDGRHSGRRRARDARGSRARRRAQPRGRAPPRVRRRRRRRGRAPRRVARGGDRLDWPESSSSSADFLDAGSGSFHGSFDDASRTAAAARGILSRRERAQLCAESVVDLSSKLSGRLIHDEWSASVAAFAAKDWRRDRKKPRVRPKDRRCNQPKARQGWNKRAMRETGVRVCVGCERMLPTTELIRVARMADADDDVDAEGHTIDTVEKEDGEEGASASIRRRRRRRTGPPNASGRSR